MSTCVNFNESCMLLQSANEDVCMLKCFLMSVIMDESVRFKCKLLVWVSVCVNS